MRKRNSIVFSMVECEDEYNQQLATLVTCFLRPLRMAASSKKPPISHEDVNSIFLNRWEQMCCTIFAYSLHMIIMKWRNIFTIKNMQEILIVNKVAERDKLRNFTMIVCKLYYIFHYYWASTWYFGTPLRTNHDCSRRQILPLLSWFLRKISYNIS